MKKIITGLHGIEEAIKGYKNEGQVFVSRKSTRIDFIIENAILAGYPIVNISLDEMNRRFGDKHRGIVLQLFSTQNKQNENKKDSFSKFKKVVSSMDKENELIIILDGVTDPHNYGAILRSAEQLGVDMVVSRLRRSVSETDAVARTSAGASNYVKSIAVNNLARVIEYLQENNFWVYSAEMNGKPAFEIDLCGKIALVLGSEGGGVSRLVSEKSDGRISIPSLGKIDSLNVSVAAGVLMYETVRQRLKK